MVQDNVWNIMFDYWHREDIDRLFFEIWKFATKKMGATDKKVSIVNICHGIAIVMYSWNETLVLFRNRQQ